MRRPLPSPRSDLWCCERYLSRCGIVSHPQSHAPLLRGHERACDCDASAPGSTRPSAAFFGLLRLLHLRFIALKAGVLEQGRFTRVANRLSICDLLVMRLARIRLTQIADA